MAVNPSAGISCRCDVLSVPIHFNVSHSAGFKPDVPEECPCGHLLFMFALVVALPIAGVFIARHRGGITEHNTRSYMSGVNAADDRHFLNSFGDVQSVYMSNWYMIDFIGELKIMKPCLFLSTAILITFLMIIIGRAL